MEIESDFRASFSDFNTHETDWSVAEIIKIRLNQARMLLENEKLD